MVEDPDRRKRIVSSIHDTSHMGLNRTTDMVKMSGKVTCPLPYRPSCSIVNITVIHGTLKYGQPNIQSIPRHQFYLT